MSLRSGERARACEVGARAKRRRAFEARLAHTFEVGWGVFEVDGRAFEVGGRAFGVTRSKWV